MPVVDVEDENTWRAAVLDFAFRAWNRHVKIAPQLLSRRRTNHQECEERNGETPYHSVQSDPTVSSEERLMRRIDQLVQLGATISSELIVIRCSAGSLISKPLTYIL